MFHYNTKEELQAAFREQGVQLPFSNDLHLLQNSVTFGGLTSPNSIAIQPMEGCDGTIDGRPDLLTHNRYERFAKSGAGIIWFEATAICEEGRANPRQLWINEATLDSFKAMCDQIRTISMKENGYAPLIIMQATHSGRYSKPKGVAAPLIAYNNPLFEKEHPISSDRIVSDDYLKQLEEMMADAALLAQRAGFDGIDIKSCHRYLACELLSSYTRKGEYGGSFENRTRFLRNSITAAKAKTNDFLITSRLNIYDGFAYPYGFGVNPNDGLVPDLTEPKMLIDSLHHKLGLPLVDITIGNPYVNPHVNRPADVLPYEKTEEPFVGVARMFDCIREIKTTFPDLKIIGSALSYMRQFSGHLAAGAIEQNYFDIAGFGRLSFAYPDFPNDLLKKQALDKSKCCITCGKCSGLMRLSSTAGCVIRNPYYTKLYKELTQNG